MLTPVYRQEDRDDQVAAVLAEFGYKRDPEGSGLRLLPMQPDRPGPRGDDKVPMAGHLVDMNGLWTVPEVRLQGRHGTEAPGFTVGNKVATWTGKPEEGAEFNLSGGGPRSILYLATSTLQATGRTAFVSQAACPGLPEAGAEVIWLTEVPVWRATRANWIQNPEAMAA
ncbi:hypothetical protein [Croceicoccus gelatinilyticus]|uniref:hypothetical protein n=1 Tax=Croceicoccus gelatinilyticus TaxID=2835536 RepID=UPI001BCD760A|nr:hypothetical protein [Croceicoccus gelatinilyticus]MBS7671403.1 hypothetical protein [Croceicoccus gelatinilyticus]